MDPKDPVTLTQALVRCPSVTPKEAGALTLLQNILETAGFECHRMTMSEADTPDVENLYARYGRQGPNLCFAGHTDVVPVGDEKGWSHDPFGAVIEDGILYGRGAVDMKGGIACFVAAALRHIETHGVRGSISLLITGDEEGPSINGTTKVLDWMEQREERIDACVVGEPTNPDKMGDMIKIGRRGSLTCVLAVKGRQGHAAYPHQADNPIPKLAVLIDRLTNAEIDKGSENFENTNLEVTIVSVPNTASNVIPAEARAVFNIRYNDNWDRGGMVRWVRETAGEIATEIGADIQLNFAGTGDVFLTKPGPRWSMRCVMRSARWPVSSLKLSTGGGTSDARFIQAYCPVIEFGLDQPDDPSG